MIDWPEITEPLLRQRQAMSDEQFAGFIAELLTHVEPREFGPEQYERAIGYPWTRPEGSFLISGPDIRELAGVEAGELTELLERFRGPGSGRIPLIAYGSNGAPGTLAAKFEHLPEDEREALILTGELSGFDVGCAAQPTNYGSMPATLFPSPGTKVRVAVLFVSQAQFTALSWTELSYRLGALEGIDFRPAIASAALSTAFVYVSRFGAFTPAGEPVALAAIGAADRRAPALSQEQILDEAARLAIGPSANAEDLVRSIFEDMATFAGEPCSAIRAAAAPFASPQWTEMPFAEA